MYTTIWGTLIYYIVQLIEYISRNGPNLIESNAMHYLCERVPYMHKSHQSMLHIYKIQLNMAKVKVKWRHLLFFLSFFLFIQHMPRLQLFQISFTFLNSSISISIRNVLNSQVIKQFAYALIDFVDCELFFVLFLVLCL